MTTTNNFEKYTDNKYLDVLGLSYNEKTKTYSVNDLSN
jgi:hypothetical protein